jgi:hypothetical protein
LSQATSDNTEKLSDTLAIVTENIEQRKNTLFAKTNIQFLMMQNLLARTNLSSELNKIRQQ